MQLQGVLKKTKSSPTATVEMPTSWITHFTHAHQTWTLPSIVVNNFASKFKQKIPNLNEKYLKWITRCRRRTETVPGSIPFDRTGYSA